MSPGDLELDALFEDHKVSWLAIDESSHWSGRRTGGDAIGGNALTSCKTSLPLLLISRPTVHTFLFSFRTLLTGGLEGKTMTSTFLMSSPWLPQPTFWIRCIQRRFGILSNQLAHWPICSRQLQDSSPDASPITHYRCTLCLLPMSIASWKLSTMSLQLIRQHKGSESSSSGFPCGASSNSSSRNARSFRWYLPACLLTVRKVLLKCTFGTSASPWVPDPVTWELRRGSSLVRSEFVSIWQEFA